jgi:hypothetical protein
VRSYTSDDDPESGEPIPAAAGMNRFVWDLQHEAPEIPDGVQVWGYTGGPKAAPGSYTARLTTGGADGSVQETSFRVELDPRLDGVTDSQLSEQLDLAIHLRDRVQAIADSIHAVWNARAQIEAAVERAGDDDAGNDLATAAAAILEELDAIESRLYQPAANGVQDLFNYQPQLLSNVANVYGAVTGPDGYGAGGPDRQPTRGARERAADLDAEWQEVAERLHAVLTDQIAAFNTRMQDAGIPGVVISN